MKKSGFTIVELLIVIVVIAILAAISIVAYNGIQLRARNEQRVVAAQQWQKLINLFVTQNGYAALPNDGAHNCLGSGYVTDWDANINEDCLYQTSIKHPSAAVNSAIATMGTFPNYPTAPMNIGSGNGLVSGISIRRSDTLDPTGVNIANYPYLWFWLEGNNQDCVLRPVIKLVSGGVTIDNTATYSYNDGTGTACRIGLLNPTQL